MVITYITYLTVKKSSNVQLLYIDFPLEYDFTLPSKFSRHLVFLVPNFCLLTPITLMAYLVKCCWSESFSSSLLGSNFSGIVHSNIVIVIA